MLICLSPLNCSNQITNLPSLLIHISYIPVCILLAFASRHKARSLGFQIFCSVGGIGPPCLYSHRLCSRNSMLHSSTGVTSFLCILLGFKSMTFPTPWLICIILESSVAERAAVFSLKYAHRK